MASVKFIVKLYSLFSSDLLQQTHIMMKESIETVILLLRSSVDKDDKGLRKAWNSLPALTLHSELPSATYSSQLWIRFYD